MFPYWKRSPSILSHWHKDRCYYTCPYTQSTKRKYNYAKAFSFVIDTINSTVRMPTYIPHRFHHLPPRTVVRLFNSKKTRLIIVRILQHATPFRSMSIYDMTSDNMQHSNHAGCTRQNVVAPPLLRALHSRLRVNSRSTPTIAPDGMEQSFIVDFYMDHCFDWSAYPSDAQAIRLQQDPKDAAQSLPRIVPPEDYHYPAISGSGASHFSSGDPSIPLSPLSFHTTEVLHHPCPPKTLPMTQLSRPHKRYVHAPEITPTITRRFVSLRTPHRRKSQRRQGVGPEARLCLQSDRKAMQGCARVTVICVVTWRVPHIRSPTTSTSYAAAAHRNLCGNFFSIGIAESKLSILDSLK